MNLPACRSILFVPGDKPERYGKALAAGADAVCIDLEDAVPSARKAQARGEVVEVVEFLERGGVGGPACDRGRPPSRRRDGPDGPRDG